MNAYFPNTLHPECWLLTCADASQAQALDAELRGRGAPSAFAAWRLQHGLVRSVACDDLAAAVRQALDDGAPVVHVHAQLPAQQLADALAPAALAGGEERLVHRRRWQDADRDLWPVLDAELDRPDAWVEVAWRLDNGTRSPVLMAGGDAASAQAYREAFGAWRSERFKLGDSGTSPFADDEGRIEPLEDEGPAEDASDTVADDAPPKNADRQTPSRVARGVLGALAASSAAALQQVQWFPVVTLYGQAVRADGQPLSEVTVEVQRQSVVDSARWLTVRLVLQWPRAEAERARQHAYLVALMPRWQVPVLVRVPQGTDQVVRLEKIVDIAKLKAWADELQGTPVTVQALDPE